ncbi:MAG TPA: hypothetical protein VKM54_10845 [Myxococcota bacterium]|nr:hypothetical protein [Myxococcota bacterium]
MGWTFGPFLWQCVTARITSVALAATVGAWVALHPFITFADSPPEEPVWEAKLYGELWLPSVIINATVRDFTTYQTVRFEDLLPHLRWGILGGLEDRYREALLLVDGLGMQLATPAGGSGQSVRFTPTGGGRGLAIVGPADIGLRNTIVMIEGTAGWRALSLPYSSLFSQVAAEDPRRFRLDLLIGPRWWYLRNKVQLSIPPARVTVNGLVVPNGTVTLPENRFGKTRIPGALVLFGASTSAESAQSWVDGVVGLRFTADLTRTVSFIFRGDIGGFHIGNSSNLTWQAQPLLEWRFSEHWFLDGGYRAIGIERGRVSNGYLYGIDLRVGYRF